MRKHNAVPFPHPQVAMLAQAIEAEVETWLACYADGRDEQGRQAVVRNGYLPEREVQTGMDAVSVHVPRVRGCWVHRLNE